MTASLKPNTLWECTLVNERCAQATLPSGVKPVPSVTARGKSRIDAYKKARDLAEDSRAHVVIKLLSYEVPKMLTWFSLYHECYLQTHSRRGLAGWKADNGCGQSVELKRVYTMRKQS